MQRAPGGDTGLLLRQLKKIGSGKDAGMVEEFTVDTGLLREMRAIEQQAAQELGQWVEKQDVISNVSEEAVVLAEVFSHDELLEMERRLKKQIRKTDIAESTAFEDRG